MRALAEETQAKAYRPPNAAIVPRNSHLRTVPYLCRTQREHGNERAGFFETGLRHAGGSSGNAEPANDGCFLSVGAVPIIAFPTDMRP